MVEIPDLPVIEAEQLYQHCCEKVLSSKKEFWKWCQVSVFSLLIAIAFQAPLNDINANFENTSFWLLQVFVFLLIFTACIAKLRAVFWSFLEQNFHDVLDGLEKLHPDIENDMQLKLREEHFFRYSWKRPSSSLGFRLAASTACFSGIWGWGIWCFSSRFTDSLTLMLCISPYIVVLIGSFLWFSHRFLAKRITSKILDRFQTLKQNVKI